MSSVVTAFYNGFAIRDYQHAISRTASLLINLAHEDPAFTPFKLFSEVELVAVDFVQQRAQLGGEVAVTSHLDLLEAVDVVGDEGPQVYSHVHELREQVVFVRVVLLQLAVEGFNQALLVALYGFTVDKALSVCEWMNEWKNNRVASYHVCTLHFNIAIDWVMRRTTEDQTGGIRWTLVQCWKILILLMIWIWFHTLTNTCMRKHLAYKVISQIKLACR